MKIYELYFGGGLQRGLYTRRDPADKHVRTTAENQEENSRSVSTFSFSSRHVVSRCPAIAIDSTFKLSLLLPAATYQFL